MDCIQFFTVPIWTVCSVFNAYNLKSLLGPKITLAKIITSRFFGVFSQVVFHLLQSSPKRRRKDFVDKSTPNSQNELNLLHRIFENFYKKFYYPIHNNSNKQIASTLHPSICECYKLPIESHRKPGFQSLHLHTFQSSKRKRSRAISLSNILLRMIPNIRKFQKNLPSTRIKH